MPGVKSHIVFSTKILKILLGPIFADGVFQEGVKIH